MLDIAYYTSPMAMGTRTRNRQPTMWVPTTDLPTAASHPFYRRLNQQLRERDASIMPRVTTGNTMAPCVIIGERAAALIRDEHQIALTGPAARVNRDV